MTQDQLEHLRSFRFLRNRQEVDTFGSTLADISRLGNVTQAETENLYRPFAGSSAQQDVLWGLLHLIEDFDHDIWLPALVAVLPEMMAQSPDWADTVTARILNGALLSRLRFQRTQSQKPRWYTLKSSSSHRTSWSGGTGRRTGLKIPHPSLGMRVRLPPPAPTHVDFRGVFGSLRTVSHLECVGKYYCRV